jgi:5-formyltetrahydrofolate cyclo-ligase
MTTFTKRAFRKDMRNILKNVNSDTIEKESLIILERIRSHSVYVTASTVSIFLNMKGEVETTIILKDLFSKGTIT